MKSKKTKRALVSSALALVLCFVMLLGTTFAWFTDNASTSVNKVQAGTLDVALEMKEGEKWVSAEGKELKFTDANGSSNILWEPGATFTLPEVRIKNDGNLAIKYQVVISAVGGDAKLAEVLTVKVKDGTREEYSAGKLNKLLAGGVVTVGEKNLSAGESTEALTISMTMDENAGNTYQGKSIEGIAITVNATQYTEEYDSTGNQYDAGATLPTFKGSQTDLTSALNGTEDVVNLALGAGTYTLPTITNKTVTITGNTDTVIDMTSSGIIGAQNGGLDITFDGVTVKFADAFDYKGITHSAKVTYRDCTIYGNQVMYAGEVDFINCTFVNYSDYAVWTYGAGTVDFENCTFYSGGKAILIYAESGVNSQTVNVKDCTFNASQSGYTSQNDQCAAIEIDGSLITGTYTVNISGTNTLSSHFNGISRIKAQKDPANVTVNNTGTTTTSTASTIVSSSTGTKLEEVFSGANFAYNNSSSDTTAVVLIGDGAVVENWTDAWVNSDTTIKGVTFKNGAVFSLLKDNVTVTLEDCTFYACDQSKLTYSGNNSLTNSGAGMCLNLEKSGHTGAKFIVKNCTFIGENDSSLPAGGNNYNADGTVAASDKKRGHAIALDAICGGGTGILDSLLIDGCVINGVRGNAIQLYGTTGDITIQNTSINSWAVNNTGVGFAIRGDYEEAGSRTITLSNVYFGLDQATSSPDFGHVNVGEFGGNTTETTRNKGTYSYPET